uniref:HEPN domain-containing protein n=1 Tax=Ignisphaera aggregans TaxID=334771 RepID=A0A7C5YWK7_9CREN
MLEVLSKKLFERLLEEARKRDMSVEKLIAESLLKVLNISLDPSDKVELHLKLCEKYLREAEDFLSRKDYVQASEKGWGAATQIVKALAAKEGRELRSHGELHKEVIRIVKETGDDEIRLLWQSAIALHQNFYENWLPLEMVEKNIGDIKKLVEKLKKLL